MEGTVYPPDLLLGRWNSDIYAGLVVHRSHAKREGTMMYSFMHRPCVGHP